MLLAAFTPATALNNLAAGVAMTLVASTAQSAVLPSTGQRQILINNALSAWVYVNLGSSTLTVAAIPTTGATTTIGVPPNGQIVYSVDPTVTTVSAISTGAGLITFNTGEGI